MTDTQRRIRAYKRALPHMRERVIAVAMLLVMSITMMTSASFAWLTLSRSPEVSSITTTVAANGNLEIALSDTDGLQPDESKVGDGNTDDVSISNLTWGNLINLAHSSYGLDYLTLRPATLNTTDLLNSPMYSVEYTEDGRISGMITDFAFTNFVEREGGGKAFEVPIGSMQYGVRAISSITYSDVAGASLILSLKKNMNSAFSNARGGVQAICGNSTYMQMVSDMVGIHVGTTMGTPMSINEQQYKTLCLLMQDFANAVDQTGEAIVAIINLHYYKDLGANNAQYGEGFKRADLDSGKLNGYAASSRGDGKIVTAINKYLELRNKTITAKNTIDNVEKNADGSVSWSKLANAVDYLCDMDSATLNEYTVDDVLALLDKKDVFTLMGLLNGAVATINGGAINDIEKLLGERTFFVNNDNKSLKISIPVPQKYADILGETLTMTPGSIRAGAKAPYLVVEDMQVANVRAEEDTGALGTPVAAETYAMAIDFWVRTNADNALLILEGELDGYYEKQVDSDGNPIMIPDPNDPSGEAKIQLEEWVTTGYKGVNRVWTELDDPNSDAYLDLEGAAAGSSFISATQGSGSCYVFYAEDPENQAQCLHMLSAMRVAFVDAEGNLLAEAYMNTSNAVEQSGRVIVPLQVVPKTPIMLEDGKTTESQYIQRLPKNEAQRITALIYMDGANLENTDVMEAGTIEGQLNIQFGTTQLELLPLDPMDDEVKKDFYVIDVITADKTGDNAIPVYDETTKCSTKVEVSITGTNPTSVKGNFISVINATQGAREETFTMQKNAQTGYWEADVPFSGPGNFQLRSLRIDGVDVALDGEEILDITIKGTAVTALSWEFSNNTHSVMTAASQRAVNMNLSLSSSSNMVHAVRGVFLGDNGQNISVNFIPEGDHYVGTANFNSSSTYRMTYVEIDGVPTPLQESMYKTITLQLGLRASVSISEPVLEGGADDTVLKNVTGNTYEGWSFVYSCAEPMTMQVRCTLTDDQNQQLTNLSNVELWYKSGNQTLDSDMTWNPDSKCYEGEFNDFKYSGTFEFFSVNVGSEEVTVATSAAKITSIPPDEMEYIPTQDTPALVYDLTLADTARGFNLHLKNADAAKLMVDLTLDADTDQTITVAATRAETVNKVATFFVPVPSDGQWTITGLEVDTVFYEGVFYDGGVNDEGNKNILNLDNFVLEDRISTYFLTDVDVNVTSGASTIPSDKKVDFMTATTYSGLTVEVVNVQGATDVNKVSRPLVDVLAEVNELDSSVSDNVSVVLDYICTPTTICSYDSTDANVPKAPANIVGRENDDKQYVMDNMVFQLAGTYTPKLTVTVGDQSDDGTKGLLDFDNSIKAFAYEWNKPSVKINDISPKGDHTSVKSSLFTGRDATVTSVFNDYETTIYTECYMSGRKAVMGREAQVQLIVTGKGYAAEASMTFTTTSNNGTVYLYKNGNHQDQTNAFVWGSDANTCWRYVGYNDAGSCQNSVAAGTLTSNVLVLKYNNVEYTFILDNTIKIIHKQP